MPNDSRAIYHFTTAALIAEGINAILDSDDQLGEAHAHALAALRYRRGTLARSGDEGTFSNDAVLTEVRESNCDVEDLA